MSSDRMINFEEDNWDWLIDKFLKIHKDEWEEFIYEEYMNNYPEPPDYEEE